MNRLLDLRRERGWNMSEASRQLGISYTTYVGYEKGEREPSFDLVCRMAEFYDVDVTYLMGTSDNRGHFPKHDGIEETATPEGSGELDKVIEFLCGLPKDVLRGILVALGAPADVLAELDQQDRIE